MVEVKKKDGESNESVIRRFVRKVQSSGRLLQAKKYQFHQKKKNKRQIRLDAQRREHTRVEREYLRKIGKLDDYEERYGIKKRTTPKIKIKK